jgi:PTS system mannose-specific IID component
MLPAAGLGLLLHSLGKVRLFPYFILGFVSAAYLDLPILVIALLGGAVAWLAVGRVERPSFQSDAEPIAAARVPRRVLYGAWVRWLMFLHASYNYERLQGLGFAHAMEPVIEHLYRSTVDRTAALKRHLVFFNSEPQFGALVPAAVIAMEEQRAAGASIPDEAINGVKSGLMGPLAGVGDSLIQGLVTPLLLSLGIGLAQQGNLSGPLLYAILISAVVIGSSLVFWTLGYRWGRSAASRILASGWVQVVIAAVSIVSLAVIGGLTPRLVQLSISASLSVGQAVVSVQKDVLDPILRGLLPLALTLSVWWLLARRASLLHVIGLLFAAGIDMSYLGLAGGDAPSLFSSAWLSFLLGGAVTLRMALLHLWLPFLATALGLVILLRRRRV